MQCGGPVNNNYSTCETGKLISKEKEDLWQQAAPAKLQEPAGRVPAPPKRPVRVPDVPQERHRDPPPAALRLPGADHRPERPDAPELRQGAGHRPLPPAAQRLPVTEQIMTQ